MDRKHDQHAATLPGPCPRRFNRVQRQRVGPDVVDKQADRANRAAAHRRAPPNPVTELLGRLAHLLPGRVGDPHAACGIENQRDARLRDPGAPCDVDLGWPPLRISLLFVSLAHTTRLPDEPLTAGSTPFQVDKSAGRHDAQDSNSHQDWYWTSVINNPIVGRMQTGRMSMTSRQTGGLNRREALMGMAALAAVMATTSGRALAQDAKAIKWWDHFQPIAPLF